MAISFVGSGGGAFLGTSGATFNFTSLLDGSGAAPTIAPGDVVYVFVASATAASDRSAGNTASTVLVPSGYTGLGTHQFQTDTVATNWRVSRKVMGSTPDTSVAIPGNATASADGTAYVVLVLRGVDTTTPEDVAAVEIKAGNAGRPNPGAITPATAGAWIICAGAAGTTSGTVFSNPGYDAGTNRFRTFTQAVTSTNDAALFVGMNTTWASGAYDGPAVADGTTNSSCSWCATTLAVRPATSGGRTGTLAASEGGADTAAASGKVIVRGALAVMDAGDTASGSGQVRVAGALAPTEAGSDTASAAGKVLVRGALATSEAGGDGLAAAGRIIVRGTAAASEASADTFQGSGVRIAAGALAAVEAGQDQASATGRVVVRGVAQLTEAAADALVATGRVIVRGGAAAAEAGADVFAASGAAGFPAIASALAASEAGQDTFSGSGSVLRAVISGAMAANEAADSFAASASHIAAFRRIAAQVDALGRVRAAQAAWRASKSAAGLAVLQASALARVRAIQAARRRT